MNTKNRWVYPDPDDPESYRIATWRLGETPPMVLFFPREPIWWNDDDANELRNEVADGFEESSLAMLIKDVADHFDDLPTNEVDVAGLVRRHWSLRFFTDLAKAKFARAPEAPDDADASARQMEKAQSLGDDVWRYVMGLPASLVDSAVRIALVTPYELIEDEDESEVQSPD